jgi:hypothetical protein
VAVLDALTRHNKYPVLPSISSLPTRRVRQVAKSQASADRRPGILQTDDQERAQRRAAAVSAVRIHASLSCLPQPFNKRLISVAAIILAIHRPCLRSGIWLAHHLATFDLVPWLSHGSPNQQVATWKQLMSLRKA